MYTYKNTFHNTESLSRYSPEELERAVHENYYGRRTKVYETVIRLKKVLCGHKDCICSNPWGERD